MLFSLYKRRHGAQHRNFVGNATASTGSGSPPGSGCYRCGSPPSSTGSPGLPGTQFDEACSSNFIVWVGSLALKNLYVDSFFHFSTKSKMADKSHVTLKSLKCFRTASTICSMFSFQDGRRITCYSQELEPLQHLVPCFLSRKHLTPTIY